MPQLTNIVARDDTTAAAVSHTFLPVSVTSDGFQMRENASGVTVDGQARLSGQWERLKNGTYRCSVKLEVPVMESVGASNASGYVSAPKVAYVMVAVFTMFAPSRSTIADRANLYRMISSIIGGASATADTSLTMTGAVGATVQNTADTRVVPYTFVNLLFPQ